MSANDFEQEIEQRLAQLQLKPSDGVWQKLEAGLQRKKRRRTFFLFFLTALLCTGGGYWVWTQSGANVIGTTDMVVTANANDTITANSQPVKKETTQPVEQTNTLTVDRVPENNTTGSDIPLTFSENTNARPGIHNDRKRTHTAPGITTNQSLQKTVNRAENRDDNQVKTVPTGQEYITGITINGKTDTTNFQPTAEIAKQHSLQPAAGFSDPTYGVIDAGQGDIIAPLLSEISFPIRAQATESIITNTQKKYPFYWGVEVMAGVSGAMEKRKLGAKSSQMDMINLPSSGYYNNSSPLVSNNAVWESQSVHRASTAHAFGVTGYKQISKRNAFSFGVSYQYLSTSTKVGDSTITVNGNNTMRTYYYGRETKNYTNKFHFINIPVTHHLILNKNEHMPFSWDLGMSVSRLLNTNALVTSSYLGGSLLEDNDAFTQTHFFIHTGLTIGLTNNKNSLWQLGPVLNYGLNKIGEQKGDDRNFWEVGIKLRYLFR